MVIKKIKNIILGNWRSLTGYTSKFQVKRLKICKNCECNVKFMGKRICNQCGCFIKAKTSIEDEKCLLNKW